MLLFLFVLLTIAGCANSDYRFEQIEGEVATPVALNFEGLYGGRDGATVTAEARFSSESDSAQITMVLYLRPPAEFRSGTYRASIGGVVREGQVESQSLSYLGGQASAPSIGGVFLLKDAEGRAVYRVRIPNTELRRSIK
jgi:hypothetical protein